MLQSKFIEITLRHVCSPVNLLHIFRTPFIKNTSGWLLLHFAKLLKNHWQSLKEKIKIHTKMRFDKIVKP